MGGPAQAGVPVWLLDVDGVLNVARPGWGAPATLGQAEHSGQTYPMRWAPALVSHLGRLHDEALVEFRWATTWVDEIAQIEAMFRLPSFPLAFRDLPTAAHVSSPTLKVEAALRVVEEEGRALIWTDDDAIPTSGPALQRLYDSGQPLLLIAPDPRCGLQPADLEAVAEFLADPTIWLSA